MLLLWSAVAEDKLLSHFQKFDSLSCAKDCQVLADQ